METPYLSKKKIIQSIQYTQNYNKIMTLIVILLILQYVGVIILFHSITLAALSLVCTYVIYTIVMRNIWRKQFGNSDMKLYSNVIVPQILWVSMTEHFQNVQLDPQKSIPEAVIRLPGFDFTENSRTYEPEYYASVMYGPIPVEIQCATIGNITMHYNLAENSTEASSYHAMDPIFEGMIYLCHLGRPFTPTSVQTGKAPDGAIKIGDPNFDKIFSVKTRDPRSMPLSDGMRRFLTESVEKITGKVYIHFASTGDLYVAFQRRIYEDSPKKDVKVFDKLDQQANMVKGLIGSLTGSF